MGLAFQLKWQRGERGMENWYESLDNDIKLELDESLETVDKERDWGAKITYVF